MAAPAAMPTQPDMGGRLNNLTEGGVRNSPFNINQRAYLEWLLTEMPNDPRMREPGRIDRYLPWSEDVPASCRLTTARVDEEAALPDEPIVDAAALEAVEGTLETR